jgi:glutamate-5-semialdehyde dehydrogenase
MHYLYTQDKEFLKKAFPVMWSCAEFWFHRMKKVNGEYLAPNEYSPEHGPGHNNTAGEDGTAHAQQMISYLFGNLMEAIKILDNAKTQRPGVCNAAECLLVSESVSAKFLPMVEKWASQKGVKLHSGEAGKEYLSLDINVEVVSGLDEAIDFINANSSGHSDCIVTEDDFAAQRFLRDVDSSSVYHNVSTRFTDGAEFGMGAEIGISTDKLHARGPMGLEELTTYKYLITGQGVVRE